MKWHSILLTSVFFLVTLIASCKKETAIQVENSPLQSVIKNTAPTSFAGPDIKMELPANITLQGSYYDAEHNVVKTEWLKVSGPDSSIIIDKNSLTTDVKNLREGIYEFELAITDRMNLCGKDTVKVEVLKSRQIDSAEVIVREHEIVFKNLIWIFPWYSTLELRNIHKYIPAGTPIKVFIKRDFLTEWEEVFYATNNGNNRIYEYFIETRLNGAGIYSYGSLYVFYYGIDTKDTPDVKVQF